MKPAIVTASEIPFASNIEQSRFELLALEQILAQEVPDYLCDPPFLVDRGLHGYFGKTGTGKTQLATLVCLAIATGRSIAGIRPRQQGPVLYLDGERSFGLRLRAAAVAHDVQLYGLPIIGLGGEALDAFSFDSVDALVRLLAAHCVRPLVTVVDTAAVHQRCDENSSDVNIVVANLRYYREKTGSAVLSLMHPSEGNPDRERGANSFRAASDVMLQITLADDTMTVTTAKNRFGPQGESWRFRMVPVPEVDKGVTLKAPSDVADLGLTERDLSTWAALPDPGGARFSEWKALAVADGLSASQFTRSLSRLIQTGKVRKDDEVYRRG